MAASGKNEDISVMLDSLGQLLGELNAFEEQKVPAKATKTVPMDLQSVIADLDNFQFVSNKQPSSSEKLISSHKTPSFDKDEQDDVFIESSQVESQSSTPSNCILAADQPGNATRPHIGSTGRSFSFPQYDDQVEDVERIFQLQEISERLQLPLLKAEEIPYKDPSLSQGSTSSGYCSGSGDSVASFGPSSSSSSSISSPLSPKSKPSMSSGKYKKLDSSPSSNTSSDQEQMDVKFFFEDGTHIYLKVDKLLTAREACYRLQMMNHYLNSLYWTMVEQYPGRGLERCLEDHELVFTVCSSWPPDVSVQFLFKTSRKKYDFFENTKNYFPLHLLDSDSSEKNISHQAQKAKAIIIQDMLSTCSKVPEIEGYLHLKDFHKKSWSKRFFVLRASGLYYSTKGMSKASKDLQSCIHFSNVNVYLVKPEFKNHKPVTEHCFCIMPVGSKDGKDGKCFCAEDSKTMLSWVMGIRIAKYGEQLRKNYDDSIRKQAKLSEVYKRGTSLTDENKLRRHASSHETRSPGRGGDAPVKTRSKSLTAAALSAKAKNLASSEQTVTQRDSKPTPLPPTLPDKATAHVLRSLQEYPWYHSDISRQNAFKLMMACGMDDGLFLVRDSFSLPGEVILTFTMNSLIYHCQIVKETDEEGRLKFHLENGPTFWTIPSLVQHYMENSLDGTTVALKKHCPKKR